MPAMAEQQRYNKCMKRLDELAEQISHKKSPPVHLWQPEVLGDIDIRIDAMGHWFHEGGAIKRPELVRLFASILWFDNDQYYLVTPAEKLAISVADVPFLVQQMEHAEGAWIATTNTADIFVVSEEHPVELRQYQGQEVPYVRVRYDLWARLSRSIYYQWVSEALEIAEARPNLDSEVNSDVFLMSGDYKISLSE